MTRRTMAIALGSNLGDRQAALAGGVVALRGMGAVAVSSLYETAARELRADAPAVDRAPYLNAVARLRTDLPPEAIAAACQACEASLGRDRAREGRHGARALDMDLLVCDREVRDTAFLRLPHPRMAARTFVLAPLKEAWPDAARPPGGTWPAGGVGDGDAPTRVAGPAWASAALASAPPSPGEDLVAERERRSARGRPPLYLYGEVGSTADVLRHLAAAGAPHATAVVAERQTAGRGRHGRTWWSAPYGSLLVSVLLHDATDLGAALPLVVGLALVESVAAAGGGDLSLKWPNDVVTGEGRKVAGILVERTGAGHSLVGIGLNLAPPGPDAPAEVRERAASLSDAGTAPARAGVLRHLLARLESLSAETRQRGLHVLLARYRARAPMFGRTVLVRPVHGGDAFEAVAQALAPDGALCVRMADGSQRMVHAAEVTLGAAPAWARHTAARSDPSEN